MTFQLKPASTSLADLEAIFRSREPLVLCRSAEPAVRESAAVIEAAARSEAAIYGVNTGFGKLASVRIRPEDNRQLQRNLILSHCAGTGAPLSPEVTRLALALKLLSFGRGASGVRWEVVEAIETFLAREILPVVPSQGSVGASGDLAPLAHMTAALIGEGEVWLRGTRMPAREALAAEGLTPLTLYPKEGLAMINGTQVSTALALAGLFGAWRLATASLTTCALSLDAAMGSAAPFRAEIHELRGHRGQIDTARRLRELLQGSSILSSHTTGDERVQDPYCLRCQPQVAGACIDLLRQAARTLEIEANAATDNPLTLEDGSIVSGGNFHAEPVAFASDQIALAISEIGAISQRRIALLVDPALNHKLPAFLTPEPGLNSGLMIAEVTSAALMSENKALANPRSVDSTPTSANQEDHVSMACHAARRLLEMNENLAGILAIEAMAGAQGVELRAPLETSDRLKSAIATIRTHCAPLGEDRIVSGDIAVLKTLVHETDALSVMKDVTPLTLGGSQ